jgi:superkiller protein 3
MEEATASCLQAVHLSPVVNFQLGLAKLANCTHQLHLPQVYAAIEQAVQHAPQMAEAHNLKGLVCECQGNFSAAIAAFKMAGFMLASTAGVDHLSLANKSNMVSLNLARVLCKVSFLPLSFSRFCNSDAGVAVLSSALLMTDIALWQVGNTRAAIQEYAQLAGSGTSYLWPFAPSVF